MDILISDLHEDGTRIDEQISGHSEAVAEISEVAVDAVAPSVAEGLYLFWFTGDVLDIAVLHVAARRGPLEIGIELDAIRRVNVNALHFAAQVPRVPPAMPSLAGYRRGSSGLPNGRRAGKTRSWLLRLVVR